MELENWKWVVWMSKGRNWIRKQGSWDEWENWNVYWTRVVGEGGWVDFLTACMADAKRVNLLSTFNCLLLSSTWSSVRYLSAVPPDDTLQSLIWARRCVITSTYKCFCIIHYAPSIHNIHQTRCNNYNWVIFGYMFRPWPAICRLAKNNIKVQ